MFQKKYIYSFGYDKFESELCKLESKYLFKEKENSKIIFSDIKIDPSTSAFIKSRLEIISYSDDYESLILTIKEKNIQVEDFKIEYLILDGDKTNYKSRLKKLRDIGFSIEGFPDYYNPKKIYTLCLLNGVWYFSESHKNNLAWHIHKQKPFSFSNSINVTTAKSLINIASSGNKKNTLLDACCGVGTIMLEACFADYNIEGNDINEKVCKATQQNLAHFNYNANIYNDDIKNINKHYDAAIIDLPYNLFNNTTDIEIFDIIKSATKISNKLVIVSIANIEKKITNNGFKIVDFCSIGKMGKTKFVRKIWVCEKID